MCMLPSLIEQMHFKLTFIRRHSGSSWTMSGERGAGSAPLVISFAVLVSRLISLGLSHPPQKDRFGFYTERPTWNHTRSVILPEWHESPLLLPVGYQTLTKISHHNGSQGRWKTCLPTRGSRLALVCSTMQKLDLWYANNRKKPACLL